MSIPLWRRYARFFGLDTAADIDDELGFHLDEKVNELVDRGWPRAEARREALRQFGDLGSIREAGRRAGKKKERQMKLQDHLSVLAQDFRLALRTLTRKDLGFAAVTILTLALGIGANTAVFSVVNTVMLRPLPFPDSDRLVWLAGGREDSLRRKTAQGLSDVTYQVDAYHAIRETNTSFAAIGSYNPFLANSEFTLDAGMGGESQTVAGVMVDSAFFTTLGVKPLLGRLIRVEECRTGVEHPVILSYAMWQRQFGGDPKVLGRTIKLSQAPYTIAGVLPESFDFGAVFHPGTKLEFFVPLEFDKVRRWGNTVSLVGRLKPGVSIERAQAELDVLVPQLAKAGRWPWGDYSTKVTGLKAFVTGKLERSLTVLWGAVGLILLLVCVNLSNLMLARAAARRKEFALRAALGAGQGRLFRQLLVESALLTSTGSILGLSMAWALTSWLAHQGALALPLLNLVSIDAAALLWTLVIAAGVAVLFSLAPILSATARDLQSSLKDSGNATTAGPAAERVRGMLVVAEVALACVLLTGAGLLLRSFVNVLDVDLGFQPAQASVIRVDYDSKMKREQRGPYFQNVVERISALPGVEAAGIADMLPLGRNRSWGFSAKGRTYGKDEDRGAIVRVVTPGYFAAMGIRLQSGRDFSWADTSKSQFVMIVNQAGARRHWPGENPVGKLAVTGGSEAQIIGVLADVRDLNIETNAGPEMYLTFTQAGPSAAELVVRSRLAPEVLAPIVMRALREINPAQPAAEFRPLTQIVERAVSPRRFFMILVGSFAVLGLILASLGIFGVISYNVTRQSQEIGIRMALGASASHVRFSVLAKALRLALIGMALGGIAAFLSVRSIESLLFGTQPTDPVTFAVIMVVLTSVALVAGYLPARRASRIDPMIALRN